MKSVLLCGGRSTRMGADKGTLLRDGRWWAELACEKLAVLNNIILFSINKQQEEEYTKIFNGKELVLDVEPIDIGGPLKGIFSVHLLYPKDDLFIMACDMIDMEAYVLTYLLDKYEESVSEAMVYGMREKIEPLCGIYSAKAISKLYALLQQQKLKRHSMVYALEQLNTAYLEVPVEWKELFTNYNSHQDITSNL